MLAASKCPLMAKFRPRNTSSTPPTGGVSRYVGRPPRGAAYAPGSGATTSYRCPRAAYFEAGLATTLCRTTTAGLATGARSTSGADAAIIG